MELKTSVVFIRLLTGEDLISEITEIERNNGKEHYYVLNNPMKILYLNNTNSGSMAISLMEWVFHRICENQTFNIYSDDIVIMGNPTEKMIEYYWNSVDYAYDRKRRTEESIEREEEISETIEDEMIDDNEAVELIRESIESIDTKTSKRTLH